MVANTGSGGADRTAIGAQSMVANLKDSAKKGKPHTGATSKAKPDDVVTMVDVAEFYRSATNYAQRLVAVVAEERDGMLVIGIPGLGLVDGQIVAKA